MARNVVILAAALGLFGSALGASPGFPDGSELSSTQAWRADLAEMVEAIRTVHFAPFHRTSEADFMDRVDALDAAIPELTDREILFGMAEIVASLEDGHTRLALPRVAPELAIPLHGGHGGIAGPRIEGLRLSHLPVRFELFDDGLFVVEATEDLERLVGAEVVAFDETPADDAVEASRRLAYADNDQGVRWFAPDRLALPGVLAHLGLARDVDRVSLTVVGADGVREEVVLEPALADGSWIAPEPPDGLLSVSRQNPEAKRWGRLLPESVAEAGALYVQIDELQERPAELTSDWMSRMVRRGEEAGADRLILDLRWNFGGSGSWNEAIVRALAGSSFNEYGRLFVLTGRRTFSAAQQLVEALELNSLALFVGEPTGSRPGHFGDPQKIRLVQSGLTLRVSTLYWSGSFAGDFRSAVGPHLPAPVTGEDHFAGRDPVLEAALRYEAPDGLAAQVEDLLRRGRTQEAVIHLKRFLLDPEEDHAVVDELSVVGHRLLDEGLLTEGFYVFTLATTFFPGSSEAQAGLDRARELQSAAENP